MKVLGDTQSVIWFALNNPRLSKAAREVIEDESNDCHVSIATFGEMSIKINLGKMDMAGLTLVEFMDKMEEHKFLTLPISREHLLENERLTSPPQHRDPFDRLIISQAIFEQMLIVSNDPNFDHYPVQRIW
jgi:PIN domain nuclease of toxin-antitoxin system